MAEERYERWIYRDTPEVRNETAFLSAQARDEFGVETKFGLALEAHLTDLTPDQVGKLYVAAVKYKGPRFIEEMGQITHSANRQ